MRADPHPYEFRRLAALTEYDVLDTPAERDFDELVELASEICETPISVVNLIDAERQWFKAEVGLGVRETPIDTSLCAHAILEEEFVEVPDTAEDPRFADNPLVHQAPGLRFYAGALLKTPEGLPLGTLCVLDTKPRRLTAFQKKTLMTLGRQVMAQLELRKKVRDLERSQVARTLADSALVEREAFLRIVTDRMPVRVGYIDRAFRYVFLNGEYERIFGFAPGEAWERHVRDILGESAWRLVEPRIRRALSGESFTEEFTVEYPFGTRRVQSAFVPDIGPDGIVRGVVVNTLDVTARYETEQALRQSEERYRTIFNVIDEGFCVAEVIFDAERKPIDLRYLEINPAYERLAGIGDIVVTSGKTIRELIPDYEDVWVQTYGKVALTGQPVHFIDEVKALGRWFEVSAARIGGEGSNRVAIVFNDITPRKVAEEEQNRLVRELAAERERLTSVFEQAPAFMALLEGERYVFQYVNQAYKSLVGHRELIGKEVAEAVPEVAEQGFLKLLDGVMKSGEPFVGRELPIVLRRTPAAEPERHYLDFVYQPVKNPDGKTYGILAHGVDVTEQVEARQRIAQSEEQFRTVFENTPDAVLVTDLERLIVAWSPAAEAITGWSPEEAIGQSADMLMVPEDLQAGVADLEAEAAIRERTAGEPRWMLRKDGSRFWSSGSMSALYEEDGSVRGFLKVFRDETQRFEIERRIRTLNEELEAKVAERTQELKEAVRQAEGFNYSISHDLRTPLRAINSTANVLVEELGPNLSAQHRDLLGRQAYNAERLGRMIDELLRLSRLARVPVEREAIDLSAKARMVAEDLDPGRAVEIQQGMTASGDQNLVRTVLENLIGNAFKFSPSDSTVWVGEKEGVFFVRDEGIGFDMAHAKRMFMPFERLVSIDEFEGTGIGLANVERIVRRHGGRVWAESERGKGAIFYFQLG